MKREHVQDAFFIVLLVALSGAFLRILTPLLVAMAVALILALLLRHPYRLFTARWHLARPWATALIFVAFVVLVAIPVALIGVAVYAEIEDAVRAVRASWPQLLASAESALPGLQPLFAELEIEERIREIIATAAARALNLSQMAFTTVAETALRAVVVLYLVVYLLADGERLLERIYELLPLDTDSVRQMMSEASRTLDATVLGTLVIGAIEGTFGALLFAAFGFPSPTLWGVLMVLVSVLPVIGVNVIIVPAGIIAIAFGDVGRGIAVMALGVGFTLITQNVVRPKLIGGRAGLHPALVLVSTLGGLAWLGVIGFIVGPVVATVFVIAWEQFAIRSGRRGTQEAPAAPQQPAD